MEAEVKVKRPEALLKMGQALCVEGGLVGLRGSCSFPWLQWKSPVEGFRKELG